MGKKKKKAQGPQGAAAYVAGLESRGLKSVVTDIRKKATDRQRRTQGVQSVLTKTGS